MTGEQPDELERRLEPIERQMYADLYEALPDSVADDLGIVWSREKRLLQLTCRRANHPFFNRIMGVGAADEGLDRWVGGIADHYRQNGIGRWMLQVAPGDQTPTVTACLAKHGLVPLRGWAKHAEALSRIPEPADTRRPDLRVETIGPQEARDWASVLAPAFDFPAGSEAWPAATVGRPGWLHYVAWDGDQPAACAVMFVSAGVGTLGFAATRPSHRRRGAQSALIAARIRDARRLELDWLVTETDEELPDRPNPSYRNIVRAGLPVRYVRANWGPPPPPG